MGEYLFIASAILSVANGTVLLSMNPHRLVNKAFFATSVWIAIWLFCVAIAIQRGTHHPSGRDDTLIFWLRLSSFVGAFFVWLGSVMRIVLAADTESAARILSRSWLWFMLSCALAILALSEYFIPSSNTPMNKSRGVGYVIYTTVISLCCLWQLYGAVGQSRKMTGIRKIEMQAFVLSCIIAGLLVVSCNALSLYLHVGWLRWSGAIWFSILHGLVVWAVCYHRVFDAKQLVLSIGQRLLLLGLLAAAAVALDQILDHLTHSLWAPFLIAITVCSVGIACDSPMRRWLGLDLSHLLLAPRHTIIEWARNVSDEEELKEKFEYLLRDHSQTNSVILLAAQGNIFPGLHLKLRENWTGFSALCKEGWITPETLQRSRTSAGTIECAEFLSRYQLGALLAVPKGSLPPSLVVGLGQKASLRPYTFPDIQVLLELAELMDNILTHSRVSAHAARLEKMASATMMSRALAHDLNNLATPVSTFLLHMEDKVKPGTPEAVVLTDAKHSLRIMQDYIRESLFFARQLVPRLSLIDAHELLTSVLNLSHDRATTAGIQVILCPSENFTFLADEALLKRMLQNLIFNAVDASQPGDSIEISASVADGNQVHLRVADQGPGISPEVRDHIFEPYFTTKNPGNEHRGFGLGLAISQKIAELHGGKIGASPNAMKGSLFTVILPKCDIAKGTPPAAPERPVGQTPTALKSIPSLAPIEAPNGF